MKGFAHEKAHDGNGWRRQAATDRRQIVEQEEEMNTWATRLQICAAMMLAILAHACATDAGSNTPEAMLVYHGSGALIDWLLALIFLPILSGWQKQAMKWLFMAAIAGNFAGWMLYMAYVSPVYYNVFMWGVTCAQCVCLLYPDRNDAGAPWLSLVRRAAGSGGSNHS